MGMVFCRGCGKEIHESAPTCPHCGAPQSIKNTTTDAIPDGIKGWSWGALLLSWVWAIGNKTWIGLFALIPIIGFIMAIVLGFKGREWAWNNKQWDSVEHFNRVQKKWSFWGVIIVFVPTIIGFLAAIAIPAYQDYNARSKVDHGIQSLIECRMAVESFYHKNGYFPATIRDAGCSIAQSNGIKGGGIASDANAVEVAIIFDGGILDGKLVSSAAFNTSPNEASQWNCVSATIPQKYLGNTCEEKLDWVTSVHEVEAEATQPSRSPAPQPQQTRSTPQTKQPEKMDKSDISVTGRIHTGTDGQGSLDSNNKGYSFDINSDIGEKILSACQEGDSCEVQAVIDGEGNIASIRSAKKAGL